MPTDHSLNSRPLRVLLIEDSENDALMLERHLRRAGFSPEIVRVETAEEMSRALSATDGNGIRQTWDVILSDYNLPNFNAPEALKLLSTSGVSLPFIVMSGAVSEETAVAAMRAGAHDYVSKQNLTRLAPAIERELAETQARRDRLAAENALRQSEQRFHRLVDAMPAGLLISDSSGRLVYANSAVDRLLGLSPTEVASGSIRLASVLEDAAGIILSSVRGSAEQVKSRQTPPFEMECPGRDGARISLLVGLAQLNPEASFTDRQVAAFLVDLTAQKQSHEMMRRTEKLAATGRLAASIAHEINNPLEAVTNCLYLMQQTELNGVARTYLDMAQRELDRVVHITTQTLRFYRQNTRPAETDIHELLETVLALYDARMRTFGIQARREFGDLPRITVYDGEIRQIFANLVGNAVDAMHGEGGRLTLRTARGRSWDQDRLGVIITIADTGTGMNMPTLKRIFEPFFSTKGSTGTGLGLWISREILLKHSGRIQARSCLASAGRQGWTVFRVFLPFSTQTSVRSRSDLLPAAVSV